MNGSGGHTGPQYPRAKKSLGQNFLVDRNVVRKIAAAIGVRPTDGVLEIGPGRGALTSGIVEAAGDAGLRAFRVLEKDFTLADRLEEEYPDIDVSRMDALEFPWESLDETWKVAGNLPYNVASRLIWDMVHRAGGYERAVFMVQHEVALRLTSGPGTRKYGALTAWVKSFATVEYLFKVSPGAFRPRPKVDSAVVVFRPSKPEVDDFSHVALDRVIKLCFQSRRKQLRKILKQFQGDSLDRWFAETGTAYTDRPENVAPCGFQRLAKCLEKQISP